MTFFHSTGESLLSVDQVGVELTGVGHRSPDRLRGDLVEDHPLHRNLRLQLVQEVPGDGLAFAVLISCEVELVGVLQLGLQVANNGLLVGGDHVQRLEVGFDVHPGTGPLLTLVLGRHLCGAGRQVTDVPTAGFDNVPGSQKLGQADRFCRRLDDYEPAYSCGHGQLSGLDTSLLAIERTL
jgi:hypothetical protein